MSKEAGKTASGPTVVIAIEQYFPKAQRVVEDDIAFRILPFGFRVFVRLMRPGWARALLIRLSERGAFPGVWSGMLCRKRYIDEKLVEAANDIETVVNLGAGLDTRTYRLRGLSGTPVFEIDQPEVIRKKEAGLRRVFEVLPPNVTLVGIDFDRQNLRDVLEAHGYSAGLRTFFIWEGVTQYLTETGFQSTLNFLSTAARGSRLAFTYLRKDFIDGHAMEGWEGAHKKFVMGGLWLLGLEPESLPVLLGRYGWRLVSDHGYDELAEEYIKPTGRRLASTTVERIAYAEK